MSFLGGAIDANGLVAADILMCSGKIISVLVNRCFCYCRCWLTVTVAGTLNGTELLFLLSIPPAHLLLYYIKMSAEQPGHKGHKNGIYINWGITDKQNKCFMFYF